jgi:hypothetical protein
MGVKGNAAKQLIIKEVFKRWDFDTDDDNASRRVCSDEGLRMPYKPIRFPPIPARHHT